MPKRSVPNLFELRGAGVDVTWTPAGLDGNPQLTYADGDERLTYAKDELRQSKAVFGRVVTVVLEQVPDSFTRSLSLVVPQVNMGQRTEQRLRTIAVLTRERTTIGGPDSVPGQVQSYKVLRLSGVARLVSF